MILEVPPKAMLFGEYGVLQGFPAVAAVLPHPRMRLELSLEKGGVPGIRVRSAFFSGGILTLPPAPAPENFMGHERFWAAVIAPWANELVGFSSVEVTVHEAWSPSLGLGSSSALLAGVHTMLARALHLGDKAPVERLQASLRHTQPGGSGYDVAIQSAALAAPRPSVWSFHPGWVVEPVPVDELRGLGLFLATHCYADTAQALVGHGRDPRAACWRQAHGQLAERFLANPSAAVLPELMAVSREIAVAQGILPQSECVLGRLVRLLDSRGIPFKSMGSGLGDMLWLAATRRDLVGLIHPVSGDDLCNSVVFDFSDI